MFDIPTTVKRDGVIDAKELDITISTSAAKQFQQLYEQNDGPEWLRVKIENGGCAGFKMAIEFIEIPSLTEMLDNQDDYVISCEQNGTNIIMDAVDASKLNGSTIDYVTNVLSSQFVISNPNKPCCGCGKSFG